MVYASVPYIEKSFPQTKSQWFACFFYPRNFVVLVLIFISLMISRWLLYMEWGKSQKIAFIINRVSSIIASFLEKTAFFLLHHRGILSKINYHLFVGLFPEIYSISLMCTSIFTQKPYILVSLEVRLWKSSKCVLFQIGLAILGYLHFHVNSVCLFLTK